MNMRKLDGFTRNLSSNDLAKTHDEFVRANVIIENAPAAENWPVTHTRSRLF